MHRHHHHPPTPHHHHQHPPTLNEATCMARSRLRRRRACQYMAAPTMSAVSSTAPSIEGRRMASNVPVLLEDGAGAGAWGLSTATTRCGGGGVYCGGGRVCCCGEMWFVYPSTCVVCHYNKTRCNAWSIPTGFPHNTIIPLSHYLCSSTSTHPCTSAFKYVENPGKLASFRG